MHPLGCKHVVCGGCISVHFKDWCTDFGNVCQPLKIHAEQEQSWNSHRLHRFSDQEPSKVIGASDRRRACSRRRRFRASQSTRVTRQGVFAALQKKLLLDIANSSSLLFASISLRNSLLLQQSCKLNNYPTYDPLKVRRGLQAPLPSPQWPDHSHQNLT